MKQVKRFLALFLMMCTLMTQEQMSVFATELAETMGEISAQAETEISGTYADGGQWVIDIESLTMTITGHTFDGKEDIGIFAVQETGYEIIKYVFNECTFIRQGCLLFECNTSVKEVKFVNCDTSKVTDMNCMFGGTASLECVDMSGIDTSNVTDMSGMFSYSGVTSLDLSSFDTSKVTDMGDMFRGCSGLSSLDVSGFDTSKVTDMGYMFFECGGLNSLDVSGFDTSNVTDMGCMFDECSGLRSLDVSGFDTSNVTDMEAMFSYCSGLRSLDVSGFDTSNVEWMDSMFWGCSGLNSLDVSGFDTSKVTAMLLMFSGCSGLNSLDVNGFDTSNVIDMSYMFAGCSELRSLDVSGFDTSNVTNMEGMFSGCSGLGSLDLSGFDTSNVIAMGTMFYECNGLNSLDVSGFDTSNVTNMERVFFKCSGLNSLDVSGFDTSNVTDMEGMFWGCSGLNSLDVSGFDTSNVTDMEGMFWGCSGLNSLDVSGLDTSNVTNMGHMFCECSGLRSLDVSGFDTSKVTAMLLMFYGCSGLRSLDVSGFDASNVTDMDYMFYACSGLETICLPKWLNEDITLSLSDTFYDSQYNSYTEITSQDCGKTLFRKKNIEDTYKYNGYYSFYVVDSNGNPISDANVTYDSQSGVTNSDGKVTFDLHIGTEPLITISKEDYITWTNQNSNYQSQDSGYETIILYKESEGNLKLKSAKCNTINLLTNTKTLNLKNRGNLIGDLNSGNFSIVCEAIDSTSVKEYQLWQKKNKIATSTDGTFSLNVDQGFVEGGNCYVRVVSQSGKEVDTSINLSFVSNDVNKNNGISIKNESLTISVADDVPYFGGSDIKIKYPDVPITVEVTEEKAYIGFNIKPCEGKSDKEKKEYYKKIKKLIDESNTGYGIKSNEKLKDLVKNSEDFALPGGNFDTTFAGYAEFDTGDKTAKGALYLSVTGTQPLVQFNTVVAYIPITVQFSASATGMVGAEIIYDIENSCFTEGGFDLTVSGNLNAFGGVGAGKVLGVGIYGEADVETVIRLLGTQNGVQKVDLTGELGVKAYVGILSFERPFAHNTWHLWSQNSVASYNLSRSSLGELWNAENYNMESLDYLTSESQWNGYAIATNDIEVNTDLISLVENTYRNAQPVMVSDGNVAYAAFLRADADTNAIYAVCTKMENGVWSEPVQADATAILDNAPQLVLDEEGTLWMAYATTKVETDTASLLDYAQNQRIVVGTVNAETLEFTKVKEFDSAGYAHMQQLTLVDGEPRLVWVESVVTDDDSVLASRENKVLVASYDNGEWDEPEEVKQINYYIQEIAIGDIGFANIVDMDSDLTTTEDWTLICYDWLGTETASVTGVAGNVTYGVLPGETESSFLWNGAEQLCSLTSSIAVAGITNDYVVSDSNIYYSAPVTGGTELAVLKQNTDGTFGEPIYLTDSDRYLENLSVVNVSGKDIVLGMHTDVEISEDSVTPSKNLVWAIVQPVNDIRIDNMAYDAEIVTPGEKVPVTVTVANLGDHVVEEVCVSVDGAVVATETVNLQPGTDADIAFEIACPETLTEYAIQIEDANSDLLSDYTSDDNSATLKLGHANLTVDASLQKFGKNRIVVAEIKNIGTDKVSGTVEFSDENGNLLSISSFSELERENMILIEVPVLTSISDSTINVTVTATQEEVYTYDNLDTVYVYSEDDEYLITYELDGGVQNEKNPLTYFSSEETIVLEEPTREHYQFEGWYSDDDYSSPVTEITSGSTKNIKLYAKWSATDFDINYELDGGMNSGSNPNTYNIETETFVLANPTKEGFAFDGWFEDLAFEIEVNQIEKGSTGNITLYAKWTPYEYIISFEGNGATAGSMEDMTGVECGTEYTLTANDFKRHGYTFTGWNTAPDGSGIAYDNEDSITSFSLENGATVMLYAQWDVIEYTITYNLNGGKNHSNNPSEYFVTTETIILENPTKEGYRFEGWYDSPSYEAKIKQIKQGTTGNQILYAKWTEIEYAITYELNGGANSNTNPTGYNIESSTITFEDAKKTGHTFVGWYTDANYTNPITQLPEGSIGDITLYAKWKVNEYSIKFAGNGATSGSMSAMENRKYGTKYTLTANAYKRNGYEFTGWNTKADGSGITYADKEEVLNLSVYNDVDVCLYAQWKKNNINGLVRYEQGWVYVKNGEIDVSYTGLSKYNGSWFYVEKGILNWNYTGLCKYNGSWYYVQKGVLNWNYTGLCKYGSSWYYVQKGVLNWNYTGLCKYGSSWYYVQKGVLNWNYTGLCKYGSSWYYVQKGVLNWNYTGLCKYGSSWYYVQKGVLNWNYTGLCKYGSSWYYVQKGVLNWNYTGLCKYGSSWYYVQKGVLNWNYTGLCKYGSSWYYVQKGVLNWNYTGLCKYGSTWYYVQKGVLNWNYTGIASYGGSRWYVKSGVMVKKV